MGVLPQCMLRYHHPPPRPGTPRTKHTTPPGPATPQTKHTTPPDQPHHHPPDQAHPPRLSTPPPRTRHTTPPDLAHHPPWTWHTTPPNLAHPPGPATPPPPGSRFQHTVYERPVRILLECILVSLATACKISRVVQLQSHSISFPYVD